MYHYEEFDLKKTKKNLRYLKIMGDIFSVMFIFDLLRGFFLSESYAMFNAIIWLCLFMYCGIKQDLAEQRIDLNKK